MWIPLKLEAHQLSVMDVVRTVNEANLILPAGDVKIGPYDYNIYANNQINAMKDIDLVPLKTVGEASVLVGDVGKAQDASQIQYNKVRINGQSSVYMPGLEARRRRQHHRRRQRRQSGHLQAAGRAQAAGDRGRVRPVGVCAHGHRNPDS